MLNVTIVDAIHSLKIEIKNQLDDPTLSDDVMAYNIKEIADLIMRLDEEPDLQAHIDVLENPMGGFYYRYSNNEEEA